MGGNAFKWLGFGAYVLFETAFVLIRVFGKTRLHDKDKKDIADEVSKQIKEQMTIEGDYYEIVKE